MIFTLKRTCPAAAHALLNETLSIAEGIFGTMWAAVVAPDDCLSAEINLSIKITVALMNFAIPA